MYRQNLKEVKNYGPLDKKYWARSVLKDHKETSRIAERALSESRTSRRSMEINLTKVKETINAWDHYHKEYTASIRKFEKRIEDSSNNRRNVQSALSLQRKIDYKRRSYKERLLYLSRPTKLSEMRRRLNLPQLYVES